MANQESSGPIDQHARDQVVRSLWAKGRACAADLANGMDEPTNADEVLKVLEALKNDGVVQEVEPDESDTRAYSRPHQVVYRLVS